MPARRHRQREESSTSPPGSRNVRPDRPPTRDSSASAGLDHLIPLSASSKRTPVACDRCKERKIKCDKSSGRCGQCKEHDVPCEVTDRNTGERHRRGQLEEYIVALNEKEEENLRLRKQIQELGVQPVSQGDNETTGNEKEPGQAASIAAFNKSRVGQNYLGAAGHPNLSMLQGSQMTLFGQSFDLNNFFVRSDKNGMFELSKAEYKSHVLDQMSARRPAFPPHQEAVNQAQLFFLGVAFFTPVVHRPAFYDMMNRKYNQGLDLTITENVIFQMVMSISEFQMAVRARNQMGHFGKTAKERLIWCLTHVNQLLHDEDLAAMQALTLICLAMRSLQRPGPAWSFCDQVLTRAMELGMHRSLSAWKCEEHQRTAQGEQMRQRIFWTLMVLHVNISGNLGLPMRLRYEDIDIEFPECTPDHLPGEKDIGLCTWRYAPYGFKLTQIMLQVYSTVCTVKIPLVDNDRNAFQLEKQLTDLENALPPEVQQPGDPTAYIAGLYLKLGIYATRLIVCHPRHLRSHPFENSPHHLNILMKTSRSILTIAEELRAFQSLDTTVYYTMDFVYAIFVALFVASQQRTQIIALESIKKDMQRWRTVLQDVGDMLGTGLALRDAIHRIIIGVMDKIKEDSERDLEARQETSMSPTVSIATGPGEVHNPMQFLGPSQQHTYPMQYHGSPQTQPNGVIQQAASYPLQHSMAQQPSMPRTHHLQHVQHAAYDLGMSRHEGMPSEHHSTIPTDSMLQPYDGTYHGAQMWHNTMDTAGAATYDDRTLPVEAHPDHAMHPQAQFDLQPWPQYYIPQS
ncbi:hypothetical protein AMS68_004132 [Peltaster fructicola]|uniref:Zn(2)-C6 fungal-type domain-containing protein n=1 Tax=Peltaster fructicola TaxID=286661 RepID=A0A6H0XVD3_9PEZI|nr:hypothetical protein AMS68_004132 [Peltaster fructicola]